jgi:agmatinase
MHERAATVRALRERGATFFSGWDVRRLGVERVCEGLGAAYEGASRTFLHIDMDVVGGSGSSPAEILGDLAEPLGLTDYEVLRIAYEVGQRGVGAATFVCIPPGSPVMYRLVVYAIMYMLAGLAATRAD